MQLLPLSKGEMAICSPKAGILPKDNITSRE